MRHSHGLRAAAGVSGGIIIGSAYEGGFFAGYISHNADGIATHGLIVAPKASGYPGSEGRVEWKTTLTSTAGTDSAFDGAANSAAMNNADHPAAQFCESLTIDGYSDWYLPARYELDIAYQNLKPTTTSNNTSWGINDYSVPKRTANRTASVPPQTSVAAFRTGGAEAFPADSHWSSSERLTTDSNEQAWAVVFSNGGHTSVDKNNQKYVRAFRKFAR